MTCPLCDNLEGTKKNTHYLTDSIIRTTLNQDGSNKREKGLYFNMSNTNSSVDFNFQRGTSISKIEKELGRETTEEENEKAKATPFSVDDIFCPDCENIFTIIETKFIQNILQKFRKADLNNITKIELEDIKTTRLFFFLQVWRTSICTNNFSISKKSSNQLRQFILNHETVSKTEIDKFPLSITYLQTKGEQKNYTQNLVGHISDSNPYLIMMNDFVIQFFDSSDSVRFFDFHHINEKENYLDYINYEEDFFIVKIVNDEGRKSFNDAVRGESKGKNILEKCQSAFVNTYWTLFGSIPTEEVMKDYFSVITSKNESLLTRYSDKSLKRKTGEYFTKLISENWKSLRR